MFYIAKYDNGYAKNQCAYLKILHTRISDIAVFVN